MFPNFLTYFSTLILINVQPNHHTVHTYNQTDCGGLCDYLWMIILRTIVLLFWNNGSYP